MGFLTLWCSRSSPGRGIRNNKTVVHANMVESRTRTEVMFDLRSDGRGSISQVIWMRKRFQVQGSRF